jgi:hypothetical protein
VPGIKHHKKFKKNPDIKIKLIQKKILTHNEINVV